jgi:hypothetical protein
MVTTPRRLTKEEAALLLARAGVGTRYQFLAMRWSGTHGRRDMFEPPPEPIRLQLLQQVFDEALKNEPEGPIRKELETFREEAMAPDSRWLRYLKAGRMTVTEFNESMRRRMKP